MAFTIAEFESIYKRCFSRAMGLAVTLLYDEEEARDVVQHVFASIWESKLTIANPDAFVYRSVRNMCINKINTATNRERIKRLYAMEFENIDEDIDQQIAEVYQALDILTEREQQVVKEIFSNGSSYKEAASNLNISVSTINKHIVNALRNLRNHFKALNHD